MLNRPVYPIGVVAEMLDVHPETIRAWERAGVVQPPQRRGGKRFYSEGDLERLKFIQRLGLEGLNLPAIRHYLQLYPCWKMEGCPGCMRRSDTYVCGKPCWKEEGTFCYTSVEAGGEDMCQECQYRNHNQDCLSPAARPQQPSIPEE